VPYDILTVTASELRVLLDERRVTSTDLVRAFLRQVQKHNKEGAHLNCINSLVPERTLLDTASQLDRERAEGRLRSPYHGIPFVAKDSMWTAASLSVPTTAGAYALKDATARSNADIIQAVRRAVLAPAFVVC
jgi:amidase